MFIMEKKVTNNTKIMMTNENIELCIKDLMIKNSEGHDCTPQIVLLNGIRPIGCPFLKYINKILHLTSGKLQKLHPCSKKVH